MQSRIIRQYPGHKTDRQTTESLGENRPIGRSLYPERDSKLAKNKLLSNQRNAQTNFCDVILWHFLWTNEAFNDCFCQASLVICFFMHNFDSFHCIHQIWAMLDEIWANLWMLYPVSLWCRFCQKRTINFWHSKHSRQILKSPGFNLRHFFRLPYS